MQEAVLTGYNTHRAEDKSAMLSAIGLNSIEDLFSAIPAVLRLKQPMNLPLPLSEWSLERKLRELADQNATVKTHCSFLGGGAYEHYIPTVIDALVSRGEFLTSYTPYQPEISQGLLQSLFEYQLALSTITGLPVVNSSSYDGATALAEAAWTCCLINQQTKGANLLAGSNIWSHHLTVVQSYMEGRDVQIEILAFNHETGKIDTKLLEEKIKQTKCAGFLFQTPNALGAFEDVKEIAAICAKNGVVLVCSLNPLVSGIITPPGEYGVDIVVCDGQPLGIPLSAGGPSIGVFSTRNEYRKFIPGRLVGEVIDIRGNLAYALVYEEREQHVAREKATSNICSNQAINALRAIIYLSLIGGKGLEKIAALNTRKAHYLADKLTAIDGVEMVYSGKFFNEFVVKLPRPVPLVLEALAEQKIFAGIDYSNFTCVDNSLLVSVTETKNCADLDKFSIALTKVLK